MAEERVLFLLPVGEDERIEADVPFRDLPKTFRRLRKNMSRRKTNDDMYVDHRSGNLCVRLNPERPSFDAELLFLRLFETRAWRLAKGKEFSSKVVKLARSAADDTLRELRGIFDAIADPDDDVLADVEEACALSPTEPVPEKGQLPDDFWEVEYSEHIE